MEQFNSAEAVGGLIVIVTPVLTYYLRKIVTAIPSQFLPLVRAGWGVGLALLANAVGVLELGTAGAATTGVVAGLAGVGAREVINQNVTKTKSGTL